MQSTDSLRLGAGFMCLAMFMAACVGVAVSGVLLMLGPGAPLAAYLLFGEVPNNAALVGGSAILAGGYIALRARG